MDGLIFGRSRLFELPPRGILEPNGPGDPLPYYYKPIVGRIYRARIEQGLSLLKSRYKSILELGYGSGILLPTLCRFGEAVFGIDLNSDPEAVKANCAKVGGNASLVRGDIGNAHFAEGSFDLIVAMSVFEHIEDFMPAVRTAFGLLCPGGELLVGMPRVDSFMNTAIRLLGYNQIGNHHVTDYHKFRKEASTYFELIKLRKLPNWLPQFAGLYFNMLWRKRGRID
jgi:2-polyprenyl-3-methyl-5-hydroxy-6-metoxy-1,4-benzoquinol methylase